MVHDLQKETRYSISILSQGHGADNFYFRANFSKLWHPHPPPRFAAASGIPLHATQQFTAARNTTSAAAGRSASSTPSRRFCSCCFKAVKAVQPSLIFRCSRFKSIRKCAPCFFGVFNLSSSPFWCDITGWFSWSIVFSFNSAIWFLFLSGRWPWPTLIKRSMRTF